MNTALVIEGGGLRGVHTNAILDTFLENDIDFPYIVAVSAGSLNATNYLARQYMRSYKMNVEYMNDKRYYNFFNIFRKKSAFDFEFMFNDLSKNEMPFDYYTFKNSDKLLYYTVTDAVSGETAFFEKNDVDDFSKPAIASSSIPVMSPPVEINGKLYYDGGVSNAVPYEKAFSDGYKKAVLILTRHKGYRKPPVSHIAENFYKRHFGKTPNLLEKLLTVPERYNRKMDEIERMEKSGEVFVIRPQNPVNVSRTEKNAKKIHALYKEGIRDAKYFLPYLKEYLKN